MNRIVIPLLLVSVITFSGCGSYKTTYMMRRADQSIEKPVYHKYAHGMGIGGFRILPAWVPWKRPIDLSQDTPEGFYKVEQFHSIDQNALAWLLVINWYHQTHILITPAE